MEKYFGIPYEFDKSVVYETIDHIIQSGDKGYVCVADGVTLSMSQNYLLLKKVLDEADIVTCDSGWVPLFVRWIYGIQRKQLSGSELFSTILHKKKYKMMFLGTSNTILKPLRENISKIDSKILDMQFTALPFRPVEEFDYKGIATIINEENPDIVWVALGMPKQEIFMYHLRQYLNRGVCVGVGAAFKFFSGLSGHHRAPQWMIKYKIEWVYRIFSEPEKQIGRCWLIVKTVPGLLYREYKIKRDRKDV
ncbi:MAG: WecB/TagA/CpsF family glycosyltransferase [Candidatus Azobacteroides sp.]|nr:WecB/TagA/CpsF family glycosyltransferase [Candidatus Azobacteroides sp.]